MYIHTSDIGLLQSPDLILQRNAIYHLKFYTHDMSRSFCLSARKFVRLQCLITQRSFIDRLVSQADAVLEMILHPHTCWNLKYIYLYNLMI